jgi:hypothetical protein
MFDYAIGRLGDDAESWFVKDACLGLVRHGTPELLIPCVIYDPFIISSKLTL